MTPSDEKSTRKIYAVSDIARRIKSVLQEQVGRVWIEGECSNTKDHSSGHLYFTLKDAGGQIRAAMFRDDRANLKFPVKDGMKLRVYGQVTIYEHSSSYQIIVERMEDAGIGNLQEAFEKLKQKLKAEGLFDPSAKKALPLFPQRIGIVTSPTGAAIRDMLHVLQRRYANLHIIIAPVPVQGEGAAVRIANAVNYFSQTRLVDVILVSRGGGSLEDLWAFNEEVLARAIAACEVPVISGVGHEVADPLGRGRDGHRPQGGVRGSH
jgi:exodeoxyribonuclease VII large subunit